MAKIGDDDNDDEKPLFNVTDHSLMLESLVSALLFTLEEQGLMDWERFDRNLHQAEVQLWVAGLTGAARLLEQRGADYREEQERSGSSSG